MSKQYTDKEVKNLYKKIIYKNLLIRRINITANKVINESEVRKSEYEQIDLFKNYQEADFK